MSVRMRHTRGHTGNRRSHHALKNTNIVVDKDTGSLRLPHRLDETTGMYRGKQIAPAKAVRAPKLKLKAAPVAHTHEHDHAHEHAHEEHVNAEMKGAEHQKIEHSEAKRETKKASKEK